MGVKFNRRFKLSLKIVLFFSLITSLNAQSFFETSGKIAFLFYDEVMAPQKSYVSSCQFYPSCSKFSKKSIKRYGFFKGILATTDRLTRCSGGNLNGSLYPNHNGLLYDPPKANYVFGKGGLWKTELFLQKATGTKKSKTSKNFRLAENLFYTNDYDLSILELKRIEISSEDISIKNRAKLLISLNCLFKKDYDCARNNVESIVTKKKVIGKNALIINFIANDADGANLLNKNHLKTNLKNDVYSPKLLSKLLIYTYLKLEQLDSLKAAYGYMKKHNFLKNPKIIQKTLDEFDEIPSKSPVLAGAMSTILPGSGYAYSGEIKEGLAAFLVNGLLGWGIYSLFANNNTGSGILTSMVSLPFYLGNIVGSINSAQLYNNKHKEMYYSDFRSSIGIDFYFSTKYFNSLWK